MNKHDTIVPKLERPRGILNVLPAMAASANGLSRYCPSAELAPFVEHYWVVHWDLSEPRVAETVPHPSVHLVLEEGRSEVVGVMRGRFLRRLEGRGRIIGTKFKAGAFRRFVEHPVSDLTDRRRSLNQVFDGRAEGLERDVLSREDDVQALRIVESFLRSFAPAIDPSMELASRLSLLAAHDRNILRVDELARHARVPVRQLQRVFSEYVGVHPKWVIRRYRLLDAIDSVVEGRTMDWSALALALGYADQAHFIRDFKKLVGQPPAAYARALRS